MNRKWKERNPHEDDRAKHFNMSMALLSSIVELAKRTHVSDIHLHADTPIYIRENGQMQQTSLRVSSAEMTQLLHQLCDAAIWAKIEGNNEADFACEAQGVRFRANLLNSSHGRGLILRVLTSEIPEMEQLGLPVPAFDVLNAHDGLVLVTGQTGSGKSTTLAAMIHRINRARKVAIYTLEDPIEIRHHHLNSIIVQREVGTHTNSFAVGLKHILRQDPDIILLGELRDFETISAALTAAETGHLVCASLHTRNAADSINRIIDVFPETQQAQAREQLASALRLVLSQRLLPAIGGGRKAAFEVLVNTPAVANIIREAKTTQLSSVMQTNAALGMITMETAIQMLKDAGQITADNGHDVFAGGTL